MFSYLFRRLLYAPLIIFGVMVVTFVIFFVVQKPETMAQIQLGKRATPQTIYEYMHKRGYDKPLFLNTAALRGEQARLRSGQRCGAGPAIRGSIPGGGAFVSP